MKLSSIFTNIFAVLLLTRLNLACLRIHEYFKEPLVKIDKQFLVSYLEMEKGVKVANPMAIYCYESLQKIRSKHLDPSTRFLTDDMLDEIMRDNYIVHTGVNFCVNTHNINRFTVQGFINMGLICTSWENCYKPELQDIRLDESSVKFYLKLTENDNYVIKMPYDEPLDIKTERYDVAVNEAVIDESHGYLNAQHIKISILMNTNRYLKDFVSVCPISRSAYNRPIIIMNTKDDESTLHNLMGKQINEDRPLLTVQTRLDIYLKLVSMVQDLEASGLTYCNFNLKTVLINDSIVTTTAFSEKKMIIRNMKLSDLSNLAMDNLCNDEPSVFSAPESLVYDGNQPLEYYYQIISGFYNNEKEFSFHDQTLRELEASNAGVEAEMEAAIFRCYKGESREEDYQLKNCPEAAVLENKLSYQRNKYLNLKVIGTNLASQPTFNNINLAENMIIIMVEYLNKYNKRGIDLDRLLIPKYRNNRDVDIYAVAAIIWQMEMLFIEKSEKQLSRDADKPFFNSFIMVRENYVSSYPFSQEPNIYVSSAAHRVSLNVITSMISNRHATSRNLLKFLNNKILVPKNKRETSREVYSKLMSLYLDELADKRVPLALI